MLSRQKTWGVIALSIIPFLSLVILFISLTGKEKQLPNTTILTPEKPESNNTELIVAMFREGLRLSSDESTDEETQLFGGAMMENALEQFRMCPDAAKGIWTTLSQHIETSEPQLKLLQMELMLDYVDQALLNCKDQAAMQNIWTVRHDIVEKQQSIERELVQQAGEFMENIAKEITTLENDLAQERKRDLSTENADFYEPSEDNAEAATWKVGPYQTILTRVMEVQQTLTSDDSPLTLERLVDDESQAPDLNGRIVTIVQEALRMQQIRYNMWVNRIVYQYRDNEPKVVMDVLSKIDSGILVPSVASLFSDCEQKNLSKIDDAYQRSNSIRSSLLAPKIPLSAF